VKLPPGAMPLIYMDGEKISLTCGKFGDATTSARIRWKTQSTILGDVSCER
jgi:hypothetical protein